jgi:branched-chain amino acid transport system permease protein
VVLNETLNGITSGAIYASIALALVLIWRGTRIVNFAAGGMAMVSAFIALSVIDAGASYWVAFIAALAFGLVAGAVIERVLIRPVESKPPLTAVIMTFGLLIFIEAVAGMIWGGGSPRTLPTATFSIKGISLGGQTVALSPFDLFVIGAVLLTMVLLIVLFRATNLGLKMRAAAFEPETARLLGVRVGRMLSLGWALASLVGALAGVLVAPKLFLSPNFMDAPLVYGFAAAVIGGLDSPVGAVTGGLALGLVTSYVAGWQTLGPSLEVLSVLVLLIVVLMVRPEGLFSGIKPRRV